MATLKQKKAARKTSESLRSDTPPTKSEILLESGYKPSIAEKPAIVFDSKGFKDELAKLIPDDLLVKRHLELLNKREVVKTFSHETGETEIEITDQPDTQAVSKALDMAYKLKGSYAKETDPPPPTNTYNFILNPQIKVAVLEFEKQVKQLITSDVQKENDATSVSGSPTETPTPST